MTVRESVAQGSRTRARRLAMQALYQWQLTGQPWETICGQFEGTESARGADFGHFRALLEQVVSGHESLDEALTMALDRPAAQLDPIERAILLVGVCELVQHPDVPYRVVINEAVELGKRYGATGSHRYINGVLDKCAANLRGPEVAAARPDS